MLLIYVYRERGVERTSVLSRTNSCPPKGPPSPNNDKISIKGNPGGSVSSPTKLPSIHSLSTTQGSLMMRFSDSIIAPKERTTYYVRLLAVLPAGSGKTYSCEAASLCSRPVRYSSTRSISRTASTIAPLHTYNYVAPEGGGGGILFGYKGVLCDPGTISGEGGRALFSFSLSGTKNRMV